METAVKTIQYISFEDAASVLDRVGRIRKNKKGQQTFQARCPIHGDRTPSLTVTDEEGKAIFFCHSCCAAGDKAKNKKFMKEINKYFRGESITPIEPTGEKQKPKTNSKLLPLSLSAFAKEKGFSVGENSYIAAAGVRSEKYYGKSCVTIPYKLEDGTEYTKKRVRLLQEIEKEDGTTEIDKAVLWDGEGELIPYGLDRLKIARELGHMFLVEGETDCLTLWLHNFGALGIPGAGNAWTIKKEYLEGIHSLYVIDEKDNGAKTFLSGVVHRLAEIGWKGDLYTVVMPEGCKDPNDLHLKVYDFTKFIQEMESLIAEGIKIDLESARAAAETAATAEKNNVVEFPSNHEDDPFFINKPYWWVENPNGTISLEHHVLAEYVIEKRTVVRYPDAHGDLYYYNEQTGLYELDKSCRKIRSFIRQEENLKRNQVREVQEYIEDMCPVMTETSKNYIAVGNGLLRLSDMEFKPFTSDEFITTKIPTNYNPKAYDEFVADTLYKVSCGHPPTMENITEMFGAVLYPKLLVPKMFYLYGRSAHNGKSSTLFMIHKTFNDGCNNISAISPQKLANNTFAGSSIYGKIANIVDDLPDEPITDSGTFKSIITGGYIDIEFKNRPSQTVQMSTVCITASNHYPNFRETGTQINKRLHIIPFDHNFLQDEDALPEMESMKRLETQQAREYVLLLAVQAVKQMLNRSGNVLTPNEKAESAKNDFAEANDPLTDFFCEYDKKFFDEVKGTEALEAYYEWCKENYNNYPLSPKRFKEKVCSHYNMEWKTKKMKINGVWKAVKGFKSKDGSNEESEPIKKEQEEKQEIRLNPDFLDL